jgi:hypothetical protein
MQFRTKIRGTPETLWRHTGRGTLHLRELFLHLRNEIKMNVTSFPTVGQFSEIKFLLDLPVKQELYSTDELKLNLGEILGSHGGEFEDDCSLDVAPFSLAEVC